MPSNHKKFREHLQNMRNKYIRYEEGPLPDTTVKFKLEKKAKYVAKAGKMKFKKKKLY